MGTAQFSLRAMPPSSDGPAQGTAAPATCRWEDCFSRGLKYPIPVSKPWRSGGSGFCILDPFVRLPVTEHGYGKDSRRAQ